MVSPFAPGDDALSGNEIRRQAIINTVAELCRESIAERLDDIERAAADAAEDTTDDEDAKPPVAKLSIALQWFAGQERPEIEAKASFGVRRVLRLSAPTDTEQGKLPLESAQ
jgi:hypothetical protein